MVDGKELVWIKNDSYLLQSSDYQSANKLVFTVLL